MHSNTPAQNHLCNTILLGNLIDKPIIRYQANPVLAIAELTLATHTKWFDKATKQYKEWTKYHVVKVIGGVVERALIHAQKGDVILLRGYLLNSKKSAREIIHATYAQTYPKGYAKSLNQVHCSGQIHSPIKFVKTEQNKELVELTLLSNFLVHSPITQELKNIEIKRPIHIWGKQATYINEQAKIGDQLVIEGKLSYINNTKKSQLIDSQQVILLK
jgi:single-stranded DNA-binding protein